MADFMVELGSVCIYFAMWQWKKWIRFPPWCWNVLQLWYKNSVDFYAKIPSFRIAAQTDRRSKGDTSSSS
jgi:hypothetical protein